MQNQATELTKSSDTSLSLRHLFKQLLHLNQTHWLILGFSVAITMSAWYLSNQQFMEKSRLQFEREASQTISLVEEKMHLYQNVLAGSVALIASNKGDVDFDAWQLYADSLQLHEDYPGILGIGIVPHLESGEIQTFLTTMSQRQPDYAIYPSVEGDEHWPIAFVYPYESNKRAIGLDLSFESNRYNAIKRARHSGEAQLTGPIELVQYLNQPGFLLFVPFYEHGASLTSEEDRVTAIKGMTYAPLLMERLMGGTVKHDQNNVFLNIFDDGVPLYTNKVEHSAHKATFSKHSVITIYGRDWTFEMESTPFFEQNISNSQSTVLLISGIVIDLLLLGVFIYISNRSRIRKHIAEHDTITGLLNRHSFDNELRKRFKAAQNGQPELSLVVIDLDHFKTINDTYGHLEGDRLLKKTSQRIAAVLRDGELFYRIGGDEFAIIIKGALDQHSSTVITNRILSTFEKPFRLKEHTVDFSASIGVATCNPDLTSPSALISLADKAMYAAKVEGRNRASFATA